MSVRLVAGLGFVLVVMAFVAASRREPVAVTVPAEETPASRSTPIPSGAVAIEAPRFAPGAEAVPEAAKAAREVLFGVDGGHSAGRVVPIDNATGLPLEPSRMPEGRDRAVPVPVPMRILERGGSSTSGGGAEVGSRR